ncbi:MAG: hypothetical protein H6713_41400 [Myxococcales bacterium]|nr:hypothetical protein [Myxococcales bacterium]
MGLAWREGPRGTLLALVGAAALASGCFSGTFLSGKSCTSDADCGPDLRCENGFCGGVNPTTGEPTTEAPTSATAGTSSSASSTSGETTEGASVTDSQTTSGTTAPATTGEPMTTGPSCNCETIDVLVVIDQSMSMEEFEDKVIAVFFELFTGLEEAISHYCSYHIGFTFASENGHNDPECQGLGSLIRKAKMEDCSAMHLDGRSYVDETDELGPAMLCLASAGSTLIDGEQNPRPAQALLNALSPELNAPGACNEGFFRPEAPLAILLITDLDDDLDGNPDGYGSPNDPQDWFSELFMLSNFNPDLLSIAALIGPKSMPMGCNAQVSPRLHEFVGLFVDANTATANICDDAATLTEEFVTSLNALFGEDCMGT